MFKLIFLFSKVDSSDSTNIILYGICRETFCHYSKLLWSKIRAKNLCNPSKDRKIIQEAVQRNKDCGVQFTGFILQFCLLAVKL